MALCNLSDVKALYTPKTISDDEIQGIIDFKSKVIAKKARASVSMVNDNLNLACSYGSAAQLLRFARTRGELAAQVTIGNDKIQNTNIEADIQDYEKKEAEYIRMYLTSSGFSQPYGRVGPGSVNSTE